MSILIIFYLVKFGREPDMNFLFLKSMHIYFSVPTLFWILMIEILNNHLIFTFFHIQDEWCVDGKYFFIVLFLFPANHGAWLCTNY